MKLQNNFPSEVREAYISWWECQDCGGNGQQNGGLEIHHITGRKDPDADSIFNSSFVCNKCHVHMHHSQKEEQRLFEKTFKWLYDGYYKPTEKDLRFIGRNANRLFTEHLVTWLNARPLRR